MGGHTSAHSHLMPGHKMQSVFHGEVASLDRARQAGDALVEVGHQVLKRIAAR